VRETLRTLPEALTVSPAGGEEAFAMETVLASERNIESAIARVLEVNLIPAPIFVSLLLRLAPENHLRGNTCLNLIMKLGSINSLAAWTKYSSVWNAKSKCRPKH
jgi:hypothetical protein